MARIYGKEGEYYFDTMEEPPFEVKLTEDNFFANMHRDLPLMDRIAIEDPRDSMSWYWWRCDQNEEVFNSMMFICMGIGTILLRGTPMQGISDLFDNTHQIQDGEFDQLLGGSSE